MAEQGEEDEVSNSNNIDLEKIEIERRKLYCDIFLKEHKNRFDEVMFHSNRYHKQVNFFQLYMTISGSLLAVLFSKEWTVVAEHMSTDTMEIIKGTLIIIAALIELYLFTNVMDALYAIYMNGRRISDIERKINSRVGEDLLTWDSRIIPRLYSAEKFFVGAWIRPNILVGLWSFAFFIFVTIGLCVASFIFVNKFFYYFTPIMLFIASITILNWFLLHGDGIRYIDAAVSGGKHHPTKSSVLYAIIIGNVCLGYIPMALFSFRDGWFSWGSGEFSFCSLISVSVGDLILIPFILYYATMILSSERGRSDATIYLSSAFISIAVNFTTHHWWLSDIYDGFMDVAGEISAAGMVHFVYSTINMAIFIATILKLTLFIVGRQNYSTLVLGAVQKFMIFITLFLAVTLLDGLIQAYRIGHGDIVRGYNFYLGQAIMTIISAAITMAVMSKCRIELKFRGHST